MYTIEIYVSMDILIEVFIQSKLSTLVSVEYWDCCFWSVRKHNRTDDSTIHYEIILDLLMLPLLNT